MWVRKSVSLWVFTGAKPGIYAVFKDWPAEGQWVVNSEGYLRERDERRGPLYQSDRRDSFGESSKFSFASGD